MGNGQDNTQARLSLEQELNALFTKNLELQEKQKKLLSEQLEIQLNINKAASGSDKSTRNAADAQRELQQAAEGTNTAIQNNIEAQRDFEIALRESAAEQDKQKESMEMATKIAGGFADAITGTISGIMGMGKAVGSLIGTIFNLTKAILSVPLDILDWFVQQAKELPDDVKEATGGGSANTALKEAMEETRKSFGDLASGPGKAVVDMYHNISSAGKLLAGTGLHLNQIFGKGVDGQAAIMKYATEMATGLGVSFMNLAEDMKKNAGYYTIVGKAFNLSGEELSTLQKRAYNMGQDPKKAIEEFSKTALQLGKALNVDTKMLSKGMVEMTAAFPAFASKGAKAIGTATAHLHKLGIEVKDLKGMFDKFDSFDSAAESASTLSQTLGVQVDAMKLVQEQDPTKKLEMMRNAFRAAGKDISQMTSAERKLALETTGMSEAMFDAAMGEGNKKKMLSETEKAAQAATKAQMDSTKAMKEMAKAIARLSPSGGGGGGGAEAPNVRKDFDSFFDALKKGFLDGVQNSKPVKDVIENIGKSLKLIYKAAYEVGEAFIKYFPGVKQMLDGLKQMFDPKVLEGPIKKAKEAFIDFFKDLNEMDPAAAIDKLINGLKTAFKGDEFDKGFSALAQGFETFMKVLSGILAKGLELLMQGLTNMFTSAADMIANPQKVTDIAGAGAKAAQGFFDPIKNAFLKNKDALFGAVQKLLGVAYDAFTKSEIWQKIKLFLKLYFLAQLGMQLLPGVVGAMFQKLLASKTVEAGTTSIGTSFVGGMKKAFGNAEGQLFPTFTKFSNWLGTKISGLGTSLGQKLSSVLGKVMPSSVPGPVSRLATSINNGLGGIPGKIGGGLGKMSSGIVSKMKGMFTPGSGMGAAGMAGVGIMVAQGLADGVKKGMETYKETGDMSKAISEGAQEFGASILSTMSFGIFSKEDIKGIGDYLGSGFTSMLDGITGGLFDLKKKVAEAEELENKVKRTREAQQAGFKRDAQDFLDQQDETTQKIVNAYAKNGDAMFKSKEQMLNAGLRYFEGDKDNPAYHAASLEEVAKEIANDKVRAQLVLDGFEAGTDKYRQELEKRRADAEHEVLKGLQKSVKDAKEREAQKAKDDADAAARDAEEKLRQAEEERQKRVERAKTLPETIKQVNESLKKLPGLEKELDATMAKFEKEFDIKKFEAKIQKAADHIAEIFPIIEGAFKAAADRAVMSTGVDETLKNMNTSLAEILGTVTNINKISKDIPTADKLEVTLFRARSLADFMINLTVGADSPMQKLAKQVQSPEMGNAIAAMTNLGTLMIGAKTALSNIKEYEKLIGKITEIANKPPIDPKGKVHAVAQVIAGLASAPGGKVEVTHNLPNVKIEIKVDMDASQVAKAIVKQPVGTVAGNNQYFGTGATKPNVV